MKELIEQMKHFNYLTSEIDSAYHEAALKLGLTDSTMLILYAICTHGKSCLLSDICKLSGIRKQTINSAIRKLETGGFIYLKAYNGRKKTVYLTEQGEKLAEKTVVHLIEIENEIFNSWSKEEQNEYLKLTQKYLSAFKKKLVYLTVD